MSIFTPPKENRFLLRGDKRPVRRREAIPTHQGIIPDAGVPDRFIFASERCQFGGERWGSQVVPRSNGAGEPCGAIRQSKEQANRYPL
jgi:hypothetical protein